MHSLKKIQRITTKAIIYRNDSVLLVQDNKGKWEMPGGKIDFNEKPEDTLRRELHEELGFKDITVKNIVHAWTFSVVHEEGEYQFIVLVYEVVSNDTDVNKSDEHVRYEWIPINKVDALDMREGYKQSIYKFFEILQTNINKTTTK